jgi:hypothetical protein
MRRAVVRAIVVGLLLCVLLAAWPFQAETRVVGLAGAGMFLLMLVGELRRPDPRRWTPSPRPAAGWTRPAEGSPRALSGSRVGR